MKISEKEVSKEKCSDCHWSKTNYENNIVCLLPNDCIKEVLSSEEKDI